MAGLEPWAASGWPDVIRQTINMDDRPYFIVRTNCPRNAQERIRPVGLRTIVAGSNRVGNNGREGVPRRGAEPSAVTGAFRRAPCGASWQRLDFRPERTPTRPRSVSGHG